MKKIVLHLCLLLILFLFVSPDYVYASSLPKPITGTFVFPDIQITTDAALESYLNGIKELGMDTLVLSYTGIVYRSPDCTSPLIKENFFRMNKSNMLENPEKLLTAARNKGFYVYIGLAGPWNCVSVYSADGQTEIVNLAKELIQDLKKLCTDKQWNCNDDSFIKGYYLVIEYALGQFGGNAGFWKTYTQAVKELDPNKKTLISPYTNNTYSPESYQDAYSAGQIAVSDSYADIIALQDSVGSGKVTDFASDNDHFRGLSDGVAKGNQDTGKNVKVWANIESFTYPVDNDGVWPPTSFDTLKSQIQTADPYVSKHITWLYQWSLMPDEYYGADRTNRRLALRNQYIAWLGPFSTPSPTPTYHPADLNHDGKVDVYDYNILVSNFGATGTIGWHVSDLNPDGKIDIFDYNVLVSNFGAGQ